MPFLKEKNLKLRPIYYIQIEKIYPNLSIILERTWDKIPLKKWYKKTLSSVPAKGLKVKRTWRRPTLPHS